MGKHREIPAGEFKAKCLALLDEVAETGREIVVTKHGRAVAKVVPLDDAELRSLRSSVLRADDIVDPVDVSWRSNE